MIKIITRNEFIIREKASKLVERAKDEQSPKKIYLDLLDSKQQVLAEDVIGESFSDVYGFWFCGAAGQAAGNAYAVINQKKFEMGIHPAEMYGIPCFIYAWTADGYPRGIILAAEDDVDLHEEATQIMSAAPWSPDRVCKMGKGDKALSLKIYQALKAAEFAIAGEQQAQGKQQPLPKKSESPQHNAQSEKNSSPGKEPVITFGKYKGMTFSEVKKRDAGYLTWLAENASNADIRESAKKAA